MRVYLDNERWYEIIYKHAAAFAQSIDCYKGYKSTECMRRSGAAQGQIHL